MPTAHNYWSLVLDDLKHNVNEINFQTWISKVQFVGIVGPKNKSQIASLAVPSVFCRNYIQKKFYNELQSSLRKYYPNLTDITIVVDESLEPEVDENQLDSVQQTLLEPATKAVQPNPESSVSNDSFIKILSQPNLKYTGQGSKFLHSLNSKYTFDNFVVCNCNQLASVAAETVAKNPGTEYNPLFIYGGVGLGKTHLMQAIGHKILENNPNFKVKYISSEGFINEFVLAMQKGKMQDFKEFYRSLDVLLVDDIQFLSGKVQTQEEFFHTFNELHQQNKQIIMTSDRAPKDIAAVEARLVSRFGWGMVVDISEPDLESRIAILQHKARRRGINLSNEVVEYVAEHVISNIRDLEGALNKVLVHSTALGVDQDMDLTTVRKCIGSEFEIETDAAKQSKNRVFVSPDKVIEVIAYFYEVDKKDIIGTTRRQEVMIARQTAMWILKHQVGMSYPSIGLYFGGKDHTTVMHACRKIDKIKNTPNFAKRLQVILESLQR